MVPQPYAFMGTYSALLRSPEQPVRCLCFREQGREQVGVRHLGHVYFACELHKAHVRGADTDAVWGSVSTIMDCCGKIELLSCR